MCEKLFECSGQVETNWPASTAASSIVVETLDCVRSAPPAPLSAHLQSPGSDGFLFRSDFEEVRKCSGASFLRALVRGIRGGRRYSFWLQHCVDHHFHINFVGPTGTVSRTARSFCKASIKSWLRLALSECCLLWSVPVCLCNGDCYGDALWCFQVRLVGFVRV